MDTLIKKTTKVSIKDKKSNILTYSLEYPIDVILMNDFPIYLPLYPFTKHLTQSQIIKKNQ